MEVDRNLHRIPNATPIVSLDCKAAFQNLSSEERLYAHHIARASFEGSLIVFLQVSPESAGIFVTLHRLFSSESLEKLREKALAAGSTEEEWTNFVVYSAAVFTNSGNFRGFGDSKFIPDVESKKLAALMKESEAAKKFSEFLSTYHQVEEAIFAVNSGNCLLSFPDKGVTCYHGGNVRKEDSDLINRFMKENGLEGWNTRLFKICTGNGSSSLIIKVASVSQGSEEHTFEGVRIVVEKGDYAPLLARAASQLELAAPFSANPLQKEILKKYADHFNSGDINDHKDGSRFWIKDANPIVESYIGFIENYRDPAGVRSEFEGFVAAVNKETSKKFTRLVSQAESILESEDEALIFSYNGRAFEVQVGLHELLGHGSGKLFQKNADGSFNFDREKTLDIITGKPVSSWYEPGETWGGVFGQLSCAYEECRAEAVGYFLCCDHDILKIFGYEGETAERVKYVNWLSEIRAGLLALEYYQADAKQWGQAHCQARFVLLKVVLEAGQDFVSIEEVADESGKPDLKFRLDGTKIDSVGRPAVQSFLAKLQGYKSTADVAGGSAFFNEYSLVGEKELRWREVCVVRRQPRRLFVQPNTQKSGNEVSLLCYEENAAGVVRSIVDRYDDTAVDALEKCWKVDQKWFPPAFGCN